VLEKLRAVEEPQRAGRRGDALRHGKFQSEMASQRRTNEACCMRTRFFTASSVLRIDVTSA
jgi:hypothetical protein